MKILVFGNPLLKQDSIPLKILPKLKQKFPEIEFLEIDPTEDLDKQGENLIILDTVDKIKKITIINSIEKLHTNKIYSMHDFDLALNLKLLKKLNIVKSVRIIGIPMYTSEEKILSQLQSTFKKCAAQLMHGS